MKNRLLACEWGRDEVRVLVGSEHGDALFIEDAFTFEMPAQDADKTIDARHGERLKTALADRGIRAKDVLVSIGRVGVELRMLSLPRGPDDELPQLTRFQAQQQFSLLGDDWPLDFIAIDQSSEGPRRVLAAAASPELVDRVKQTCDVAGLRPRRMVLRSCATASWLRHHDAVSTALPCLLVCPTRDEADLIVLVDETVVFLRTLRWPTGDSADARSEFFAEEIHRTMAAAGRHLDGAQIRSAVFCGDEGELRELAEVVEQRFQLNSSIIGPFEGFATRRGFSARGVDHPEQFASLVGLLSDEIAQRPHDIDFLNPRRPSQRPGRRRLHVTLAVAAVVAIMAVGGNLWIQARQLDRQIQQLSVQSKQLDKSVERGKELQAQLKELDGWSASDVTWLDEIRYLSAQLPEAAEVRVDQVQMDAIAKSGGRITLRGHADKSETIENVERSLRDDQHTVLGDGARSSQQQAPYPWEFTTTVSVLRPPEKADQP